MSRCNFLNKTLYFYLVLNFIMMKIIFIDTKVFYTPTNITYIRYNYYIFESLTSFFCDIYGTRKLNFEMTIKYI